MPMRKELTRQRGLLNSRGGFGVHRLMWGDIFWLSSSGVSITSKNILTGGVIGDTLYFLFAEMLDSFGH